MIKEKKQENKMDMQAMMDVYTKLGTPGAPHKMLASMAGSWNTNIKVLDGTQQASMEIQRHLRTENNPWRALSATGVYRRYDGSTRLLASRHRL